MTCVPRDRKMAIIIIIIIRNFKSYAQSYPQMVATTTTTSTSTTTEKPIVLVEKSVIPPFGEIPLPLMQLNEIPKDKNKGM